MFFALCEHKRRPSASCCFGNVLCDKPISRFACAELLENMVVRGVLLVIGNSGPCEHGMKNTSYSLLNGLFFGVDDVSNGTAEHEKRSVETVRPFWRRRKPVDVFRGRCLQNHLKMRSGGVVTFVADNEAVIPYCVFDARLTSARVLLDERLERRNVYDSGYPVFPAADLPNDKAFSFAWPSGLSEKRAIGMLDVEKLGEPRRPLGDKRGFRHDNKRR